MMQTLRALIVEDSDDDAVLLAHTIRRGGFNLYYERVDTPDAAGAHVSIGERIVAAQLHRERRPVQVDVLGPQAVMGDDRPARHALQVNLPGKMLIQLEIVAVL